MLSAEATPAPADPTTVATTPTVPAPAQAFQQQQAAMAKPSTAAVVLGTVAFLGLMFGLSAAHGQWAYGDWTCAFKNCVAVAPVRRRKR